MALREYQSSVTLSKLYEVNKKTGIDGDSYTLNPSLWADDVISIYASDSATQPTSLADMTLSADETDVSGKLVFGEGVSSIPRYIAVTGSATEVVATGLFLKDLGAIS